MSRIEDGGAVEAGLVDIAEELISFAYCVDGEVGNGSFAVYDKAGVDSGAIARNLRAVLREAAAEITRLRAENAHWKRQAEAAQNNASLFQQDCALHVAEKRRKDEALKPFAALLDIFQQGSSSRPSKGQIHAWVDHRIGERELTVEMLEDARAALSNSSQAEGQTP